MNTRSTRDVPGSHTNPTECVYPAECSIYKTGDDTVMLRNLNDRRVHRLPEMQVALLGNLRGCRPIADHFETLSRIDHLVVSSGALWRLLESWIALGLLRPHTLLQRSIPGAREHALVPACLTCDRPELLRRWVDDRSKIPAFQQLTGPTLVLDDTRDRRIRRTNRVTVTSREPLFPGGLEYMDRDDRERYCKDLATAGRATGLPEDVVRFALLGEGVPANIPTTGANRNTLLLVTAGCRVHSSDDDMGTGLARFRDTRDELPSVTDRFRMPLEFFPDLDSMTGAIDRVHDGDLLKMLGASLDTPINLPDELPFVSAALARRLETGDARIRGVAAGYFGARHHVDPNRTLATRAEYPHELIHDEAAYRSIRAHGFNIQHSETFTLDGTGIHFPTATIALDNTELLAPFPPGAVHQDSCWRLIEHAIAPAHLFAHLPIAVYHDPRPKGPYADSDFLNVAVNLGYYTILFLQSFGRTLLTVDENSRLRELGDRFVELSEMKILTFEASLKHLQVQHLGRLSQRAAEELDLYEDAPPWWTADVHTYRESLKIEIQSSAPAIPLELQGICRDKGEALGLTREYFRNLGELLRWWPTIWTTARDFNGKGRGIV